MQPIDIGSRRELFVDGFLIERMERASLKLAQPERGDVAFTGGAAWEDYTLGALSVVEEGNEVRLYYRAAIPDLKNENVCLIAMAVSTDGGRSFHRPDLGLVEFQGSKKNNLLWHGGLPGVPPAFIDTRPGCPAEERYKGFTMEWGKLFALRSSDGLRWSPMHDEPLKMDGTFDTINTAFWDSFTGCYRSYTRSFNDPVTGKPYPYDAVNWTQGVRAIQASTSADFIHWSPVEPVVYEDGDLSIHMYTNDVTPCPGAEHIYIGFPNRIYPQREKFPGGRWPGVNDAMFMASRDGLRWTRYREAWVRPGRDQRNWTQRNNYPAWGIIRGRDEEWALLISEHYMQPDNAPCRFRRLTMRPWGFASVSAGYEGGEVTTKPFVFNGGELRLNYATSAGGSVQVEMQDGSGKSIPGFTVAEMTPLFGDELDATVTWKTGADVSSLSGRPVRMRLLLKDADVFAFRAVEPAKG